MPTRSEKDERAQCLLQIHTSFPMLSLSLQFNYCWTASAITLSSRSMLQASRAPGSPPPHKLLVAFSLMYQYYRARSTSTRRWSKIMNDCVASFTSVNLNHWTDSPSKLHRFSITSAGCVISFRWAWTLDWDQTWPWWKVGSMVVEDPRISSSFLRAISYAVGL